MASFDLTGQKYALQSAPIQIADGEINRKIVIKGSDITKHSTTASDTFEVCNLGQNIMVTEMAFVVLDADDTAITLKVGYSDGTNTDDDAYDADVALDSTGITALNNADFTANKLLIDEAVGADFKLILTFSALSTLDDATEFVIYFKATSFGDAPYANTLNAPV